MKDEQLVVVGAFSNDTTTEMRLYLELLCEQIVMKPGHSVELLARKNDMLIPLTICYVSGGMQIYPYKVVDPEWHVRFNGKLLKAGHPTVLADHE
jgi:hypothetical protein